ncbi:MAG TPA: cyanophycin synthetase [Candidatus Limnocylindrales bacterium]|nr:cyanophycin synthetase [Candidatus Limnocylindrales bacterium]
MTGAASIGAGLEPARDPRPIRPGERIHVLGIAGAGASAAARLAAWAGAEASGCDPGGPSPYTVALADDGLAMAWEHDPSHVAGPGIVRPDRLAVTKALTAIAPDHPELEAARAAGIPLEPWQQVVADAAVGHRLVGVAGTHGKSTTSGWLVHVLESAGLEPTAFVGALMHPADGGPPSTALLGRPDGPFVVEADEYAGNFDPYRPSIALLTSAEWDHPDVFADEAAVLAAFERWVRRMNATAAPPVLVANVGDPGVEQVASRLSDWAGGIDAVAVADVPAQRAGGFVRGIAERFATAAGAANALLGRIVAADRDGTAVEISGLDDLRGPVAVRLPTAGSHNVANALGVAAAARRLGLSPEAIAAGLASFPGVARRLERKGEAAGVVVYDDYGHHPTAIRATLAAVRQREPGRRIWAVYEPLTFHRTAALLQQFADVLAEADAVAVADIWAGRDPDTTIASAEGLANAVAARRPDISVAAPGSVEETGRWLAHETRPGDVVLVMGGGRSYRIGEVLLEELSRRR